MLHLRPDCCSRTTSLAHTLFWLAIGYPSVCWTVEYNADCLFGWTKRMCISSCCATPLFGHMYRLLYLYVLLVLFLLISAIYATLSPPLARTKSPSAHMHLNMSMPLASNAADVKYGFPSGNMSALHGFLHFNVSRKRLASPALVFALLLLLPFTALVLLSSSFLLFSLLLLLTRLASVELPSVWLLVSFLASLSFAFAWLQLSPLLCGSWSLCWRRSHLLLRLSLLSVESPLSLLIFASSRRCSCSCLLFDLLSLPPQIASMQWSFDHLLCPRIAQIFVHGV